jgi:LmbE family N-acetylglucosaminyl deacetylase
VDRRRALQTLVAGAGASILYDGTTVAGTPLPADGQGTALFFAPHPDDEVLQQLVEIMWHVSEGWHVVVVDGSNGDDTVAIQYVNGDIPCDYHGYRHVPPSRLVPGDIGRARIHEQRSACGIAGVHEYVPGRVPDAALTVDGWRKIILAHAPRLRDGDRVFAPTPWESTSGLGNPQHGDAGVALKQLLDEPGKLPRVTAFYTVFSRYWDQPGCPDGTTRGFPSREHEAKAISAAQVYQAYNPSAGSYGIGWCHSVQRDFEAGFAVTTGPRYLRQRYHL